MRRLPSAFLLSATLLAFAAPSTAKGDTIYVEKGKVPTIVEIAGWTRLGGEVIRPYINKDGKFVRGDDGKRKEVTYSGIRGRIVSRTYEDTGVYFTFQPLLQKTSTLSKPGAPRSKRPIFRYHPDTIPLAASEIVEIVQDFDSLLDLRDLLGNDDIRVAELGVANPKLFEDHLDAADIPDFVKLLERGDDWVYAYVGYGGIFSQSIMTHRLGIKDKTWTALGTHPSISTTYEEGWLSYLVQMGAPTVAEQRAALSKALAEHKSPPASSRIPLIPSPFRGVKAFTPQRARAPGAPAPPPAPKIQPQTDEAFLGAKLRTALRGLLLGAARDDRYNGVILNGNRLSKFNKHYLEMVIKIMRELCSWAVISETPKPGGASPDVLKRARAVGRVARSVVIEALEDAQAGRQSPFDRLNGRAVGAHPKHRLLSEDYMPVDPSRVAIVAMRVIQNSEEWKAPSSAREARRLIRVLIRLARPRFAKDPTWNRDPRRRDLARQKPKTAKGDETFFTREVFLTLGGAASEGLLVSRKAAGTDLRSPYLDYAVELLESLEPRDRQILLLIMTQAGVGDSSLYQGVVNRLFSICLDNEGWEKGAPLWVRNQRRDAVASLGLLATLEARLTAQVKGGNKTAKRIGSGSVAQMIFKRLDELVDARLKKRATKKELEVLEMIRKLALGKVDDPRAAWLPNIARSRTLATDLTNAYHEHAKKTPNAIRIAGSRELESMREDHKGKDEVERRAAEIKDQVDDATERLRRFPEMFPVN